MSDTLSGFHLITKCGNTNQDTTWILKNLPEGTYYWKVQAIDNVFQSSEFSVIDTFTVLPAYSIIELSSTGMSNGSISIGDYDNDLDLDILVKGEDDTYVTNTKLFRNDGDMVFSEIVSNFIGLAQGGSDWGDYDNDGDLDLVYTGITNTDNYGVLYTLLYRNDLNGIFTELQTILPAVSGPNGGNIKWADFDNDGYLDIILTGRDTITYKDSCRIFKNIKDGFKKIPTSMIPGVDLIGNIADMDNDGDLDISITARQYGEVVLPDAASGQGPGSLARKLSRCKEGMAHFLPSSYKFY